MTTPTTQMVVTSYDDLAAVRPRTVELGDPGPGQVLVRVQAAGMNPVDYKAARGMFGTDPQTLPLPLGREAAGVVVAVGAEAVGPGGPLGVGDPVVVYPAQATFATHVLVPASSVLPRPDTLGVEEAAGLLLVGVTAQHALTATRVGAGDTVLIHAAAGGVGLIAVQLAVAAGARVIGTASPSRHEELVELGAQPVAYGEGLLERVRALAPDGVSAALDLVGSDEALDTSVELVADRSRIATIAGFVRGAELGIQVLGNGPGADPGTELRTAARPDLLRRAGAGELRVAVARSYPLGEAAAALVELAAGHVSGKLVLLP